VTHGDIYQHLATVRFIRFAAVVDTENTITPHCTRPPDYLMDKHDSKNTWQVLGHLLERTTKILLSYITSVARTSVPMPNSERLLHGYAKGLSNKVVYMLQQPKLYACKKAAA
jgi:hypothetical protein